MQIRKGFKAMLAKADAAVQTLDLAQVLALHGRDDVAHVEGGFSAWKQAGDPMEAPNRKA